MISSRNKAIPDPPSQVSHKTPPDSNRLLRLPDVMDMIPVSRSCWWSWVASGKAPAPIRLGRCTCWRYSDLMALIGKEDEK